MKRIILYCSILISMIANACNVCDNSGSQAEIKPSDVYFTAKLLNSASTAIYAINSDGAELKVILNDSELHSNPSEDGKIIVVKSVSGRQTIELFDLKLGQSRELLTNSSATVYFNPGISPDGKKAFAQIANKQVILIDLVRNTSKVLDQEVNSYLVPSFSQDSKYFAFMEYSESDANRKLKVVSAESPYTEVHSIAVPYSLDTNSESYTSKLHWSADNSLIYIAVSVGEISKVAKINISTNTCELLNLGTVSAFDPLPSPNNQYIVFADIDGSLQKAVMNSDGTCSISYLIKVNLDEKCQYPSFNRKASALIYTKTNKSSSLQFAGNLYVTDLNTGISRYLFSNVFAGFWYPG